jgi:hypothetical protein
MTWTKASAPAKHVQAVSTSGLDDLVPESALYCKDYQKHGRWDILSSEMNFRQCSPRADICGEYSEENTWRRSSRR